MKVTSSRSVKRLKKVMSFLIVNVRVTSMIYRVNDNNIDILKI